MIEDRLAHREKLEPEIESGQLVIDKRRAWRPLRLTLHLNEQSDYYYAYFLGDKDTFHLAWRRCGFDYALVPHGPRTLGDSEAMLQFDWYGAPLFQHRGGNKWSLLHDNPSVPGFADEQLCLRLLEDLRARWQPPVRELPRELTAREREVYERVCAARVFAYEQEDAPGRMLELLSDFRVGYGVGEMETAWMIEEDKDGAPMLTLRNANAPTCFLREEDRGWHGRWRVYSRGRVALRPQASPAVAFW